jgi:hypothetical protein
MKTPRELLFTRHKNVMPRLDQIRDTVVDGMFEKRRSITQKLWEELILPARRVWAGLGVAWIVVIAMNFLTGSGPHVNFTVAGPIAPESVMALQRSERLMARAGETDAQPAEQPEIQPRSDIYVREKVV